MKRKLISKMLVLTFTIVGIGMFSSCKDYEEDMAKRKAKPDQP